MGGAVKKVASVATLGISDAVLGATQTPRTSTTSADEVKSNEVSTSDADSYAADKKRRAKAAGLSSTILGGTTNQAASTATKTLLGA
ncbi:hypothetical protein [Azotobacter vinelandii]